MNMKKLYILFLALLLSCSTQTKIVEVPVERVKIEYKDKLIRDSIYVSEKEDTEKRNDTTFITKYKYMFKDRLVRDTVLKQDTIPKIIEFETVKEVNNLKYWQIILMVLGGGALALGGYKLIKVFKV